MGNLSISGAQLTCPAGLRPLRCFLGRCHVGLCAPWPPAAGAQPSLSYRAGQPEAPLHTVRLFPSLFSHLNPMSMIPWQELFLAVGASPDVHRQSAWSRLHLAEAAVSWVSHVHLRQEERQTWVAADLLLSPAWSQQSWPSRSRGGRGCWLLMRTCL